MVFRRLVTLLTALSLLLCVATAVLWVRSYWRYDMPLLGGGQTTLVVHSIHGSLDFVWIWNGETARRPAWARHMSFPAAGAKGQGLMAFGASYALSERVPPMSSVIGLWMPHWAVAVASAIVPVWRSWNHGRRLRAARSARRGFCPSCGYDLRATPDRCPECGTESLAIVSN